MFNQSQRSPSLASFHDLNDIRNLHDIYATVRRGSPRNSPRSVTRNSATQASFSSAATNFNLYNQQPNNYSRGNRPSLNYTQQKQEPQAYFSPFGNGNNLDFISEDIKY